MKSFHTLKNNCHIIKVIIGILSSVVLVTSAQGQSIKDFGLINAVVPFDDLIAVLPSTSTYVQKWGKNTTSCGSKTHPCKTIHYGIGRAASGTEVYVGSGVYVENVVIKKPIKLLSLVGPDSTIIKAGKTQGHTLSIKADNVQIGKRNHGFTFTGSEDGSGLYSIGSNVTVEGNRSIDNRIQGFQFGVLSSNVPMSNPTQLMTVDLVTTRKISRVISFELLEKLAFEVIQPDPGADGELVNQSSVSVSYNVAENNGEGGFYFSDFSHSTIANNEARDNQNISGTFFGFGSGFWIDTDSQNVIFKHNVATGNQNDGVFYRAFGVVSMDVRSNQATENGADGFRLMGEKLYVYNNLAANNGANGLNFMGYGLVEAVDHNTTVGNTGVGILFSNLGANGVTIDTVRNNNLINNDSNANNCGIDNQSSYAISPEHNFWGNMDSPGFGPNPADNLCGNSNPANNPASTMNVSP